MTGFLKSAEELLPRLVELRRQLHREPEVGLHNPQTQLAVLDALADLDLEISTGAALSSVTAVLRGGKPGPTVLLRADMDALPIEEKTEEPFASGNGAMHACGHDMHTAGLVGAAHLLAQRRAELSGNVVFMFQPGEEVGDGARLMLEEGVLDASGERPIAAFALHVGPGPRGLVITRPGPMMAAPGILRVTMHGQGGHGSQPSKAIDPVPAIAAAVTALPGMVARRFDPFDPLVLTVTQLSASDAVTAIPASASLGATVRFLSKENINKFQREVETIVGGIAAAHGCTSEVEFTPQLPVTVNNPTETGHAVSILRDALGDYRVQEVPNPFMGGEDFSHVLAAVPGTYLMLLCSPIGVNFMTADVNHSPGVVFDDAVLGEQAAILAHLAFDRLAAEAPKNA